jgi:hypothetical protein
VRCGRIHPEPRPQRVQIGGRRCQLAVHLPRHRRQGRGVACLVGRAHGLGPLPLGAAGPASGADQRITPGLVVQVGQPGLAQGLNGGV